MKQRLLTTYPFRVLPFSPSPLFPFSALLLLHPAVSEIFQAEVYHDAMRGWGFSGFGDDYMIFDRPDHVNALL
jgi:hypothetical protein